MRLEIRTRRYRQVRYHRAEEHHDWASLRKIKPIYSLFSRPQSMILSLFSLLNLFRCDLRSCDKYIFVVFFNFRLTSRLNSRILTEREKKNNLLDQKMQLFQKQLINCFIFKFHTKKTKKNIPNISKTRDQINPPSASLNSHEQSAVDQSRNRIQN